MYPYVIGNLPPTDKCQFSSGPWKNVYFGATSWESTKFLLVLWRAMEIRICVRICSHLQPDLCLWVGGWMGGWGWNLSMEIWNRIKINERLMLLLFLGHWMKRARQWGRILHDSYFLTLVASRIMLAHHYSLYQFPIRNLAKYMNREDMGCCNPSSIIEVWTKNMTY